MENWVLNELKKIDLNDERLNQRAECILESFSISPQSPINQAQQDQASVKAAYRFFDNPKVTEQKILEPHYQNTIDRIKHLKTALVISDTCFMNYTSHPETEGLGPIAKKDLKQMGIIMHSAFVVDPDTGCPIQCHLTPQVIN